MTLFRSLATVTSMSNVALERTEAISESTVTVASARSSGLTLDGWLVTVTLTSTVTSEMTEAV